MPASSRPPRTRTSISQGSKTKQLPHSKPSQPPIATPSKSAFETTSTTGKRKRDLDKLEERSPIKSSDKRSKQESDLQEEKRLKTFRKHAPKSFLEKLTRAQTQRMIVVGRKRSGSGLDLREEIDIIGSTGNIYKVTLGRLPECTCPDHRKGNECKHKVYALHTVLKAPDHLQYQRAFLTSELDEIFSGAPPLPTDIGDSEDRDGKRKPVEGECPICYMDLDEEHNELVWCKTSCGNNMHKTCVQQWIASQRGQPVRCVYCRADWEMDNINVEKIRQAGSLSEEGYINVAEQFGISRARDYTSYYQPWARRQFGVGW